MSNPNGRKGATFERQTADWLNEVFGADTFHPMRMGGANDQGDVWGLYAHGKRIVLECKNCKKMELAQWIGEAERERGNADALAKAVVIKRRGVGPKSFGETYCLMEMRDLVALITGEAYE